MNTNKHPKIIIDRGFRWLRG